MISFKEKQRINIHTHSMSKMHPEIEFMVVSAMA